MFESRSKFIVLKSLSFEQAPTYCHIVQKIQKMRYCSLSGSRRIYTGRGMRSLFHLMMHWIVDSQFSWRTPSLQNWIHRLFQLLSERIYVFVTEPHIFVSWASQRVLLQLLVDRKSWRNVWSSECIRNCYIPCEESSFGLWNKRYAVWTFSVWSKEAGWFLSGLNYCLVNARQIVSFRRLCLACLPALRLQLRPCRPLASTRAPQLHRWGSHNFAPGRRPTATRMVSLDIRKPMDVIGGALSQSPVCAAFEARIRALSIWDVQLAKSMLKVCSVIILAQHFCLP